MAFRLAVRPVVTGTALLLLASCAGGTPISPNPEPPPGGGGGTTPVLPFLVGNTGPDRLNAIAVDGGGNVWVAGSFSGTVDFDPSSAVVPRTALGATDLFLARYTSAGALVRVVTFGGSGDDRAMALRVDDTGNAWIAGAASTGYLCPGIATTTPVLGPTDILVARLNSGGTCDWVNVVGSTGTDEARAISVSTTGVVTIAGNVAGVADFDVGTGVTQPVQPFGGGTDLFVAGFSATGSLQFASTLGGSGNETADALVTDAAGAHYLTASVTGSVDVDPGATQLLLPALGTNDALVLKLTATGGYVWASRIGAGTGTAAATPALALDGSDVVTAFTVTGTVDLDAGTGVVTTQAAAGTDGVIARYATATGALTGTPLRLGGTGDDAISSLAVITGGTLAVAGRYSGALDADPTAGVRTLQSSQSGALTEAFHLVLAPAGTPVWAAALGGTLTGSTLLSSTVALVPAPGGTFWAGSTLYGVVDADPSPSALVPLAPFGQGDGAVVQYSATGALQR